MNREPGRLRCSCGGRVWLSAVPLAFFLLPSALLLAGEEYVYEGKTAADWAKALKAGENEDKARHALVVLGKDAIPALVQLLKEPGEKTSALAMDVLANLKPDKSCAALLLPLLKDESFEVRRAAVRALARYLDADPDVAAAVKGALNDRDKAVAEAAEQVLSERGRPAGDPRLRKAFDKVLGEAKQCAAKGQMEEARGLLDAARELGLDDPEAVERLKGLERVVADMAERQGAEGRRKGEENAPGKGREVEGRKLRDEGQRRQQFEVLLKQARIMAEKGELENALRVVREAARNFPDDERATELLKRVEARLKAGAREKGAPLDKEGRKPEGEEAPANF